MDKLPPASSNPFGLLKTVSFIPISTAFSFIILTKSLIFPPTYFAIASAASLPLLNINPYKSDSSVISSPCVIYTPEPYAFFISSPTITTSFISLDSIATIAVIILDIDATLLWLCAFFSYKTTLESISISTALVALVEYAKVIDGTNNNNKNITFFKITHLFKNMKKRTNYVLNYLLLDFFNFVSIFLIFF